MSEVETKKSDGLTWGQIALCILVFWMLSTLTGTYKAYLDYRVETKRILSESEVKRQTYEYMDKWYSEQLKRKYDLTEQ